MGISKNVFEHLNTVDTSTGTGSLQAFPVFDLLMSRSNKRT
jgi:hypothetical protein